MASLSTGSCNFPTRVYENAPDLVDWLAAEMLAHGVKPEIEAFDLSMIFKAVEMAARPADRGAAARPVRHGREERDAGRSRRVRVLRRDAQAPGARRDLDRRRDRPRPAHAEPLVARARRALPHRARGQRAPRTATRWRRPTRRWSSRVAELCAEYGRRPATAAEARALLSLPALACHEPALWQPRPEAAAATQIAGSPASAASRGRMRSSACGDGRSSSRPTFWQEVWDLGGVKASRAADAGAGRRRPDAGRPLVRGRAAELRREPAAPRDASAGADLRAARTAAARELSWARAAGRGARASPRRSRRDGVGAGDRVAGYLPNMPETIVAMLAATRARRDLVVVLARLRRRRACSTASARSSPRCCSRSTATATPASASTSATRSRRSRPASAGARSATVLVPFLDAGGRRPGRSRRGPVRRAIAGRTRPAARVRAAALRPPALHPLLLGHDRRAEVHRARRRRHAAPAPEGAPAAHRRAARRARLLLHDLRLDDVELARRRARGRGDAGALRRLAVPSRAPTCSGTWPTSERVDGLRHQRQVHRRLQEGRARAAHGHHDLAPCARSSRPARRWCRRASTTSTRRSRRTCSSPRSRAAPTSSPASCSATRRGRSGAARSRCAASGMAVDVFDDAGAPGARREGRAGLHPAVPVACRSGSGTTRTARATARPTSSASRASGATATSPSSPRTAA